MRTYQATLDFLYAQLPVFEHAGAHAYKPGLARVEAMDQRLGHPHRRFRSVHVAGTNGKGSTSHLLASVLQAAGLHVGLFTSPHLLDFAERIRVDGEPIDHDYVVRWTEEHYSSLADLQPSFFELATMLAFCYFAYRGVDVAVVEVGLGGRLDSTNILTPELCVITNVSFDHTQLLGDTLPQIAAEKAGIMKRGVPCVIGEVAAHTDTLHPERNCTADALRKTFNLAGDRAGAPRFYACDDPQIVWVTAEQDGRLLRYETADDGTLRCPLTGACQPKNANTVLTAIHLLRDRGFVLPAEAVADGFLNVVDRTHLMGRWQTLAENPHIIADTGHNEGCFRYLGLQLHRLATHEGALHIVFGMVADKDIDSVLPLLPTAARYYFCHAPTPRALAADRLAAMAAPYGLAGTTYASVADALNAARAEAAGQDGKEEGTVFVGGSTFVVAEAMKALAAETETHTTSELH